MGIASEIHSRCDYTQIYQNFRHESLNWQIPMVCKRSHYSGITMYSFETLIAYSCLLWETNSRSSSTYLSTWLAAEQCNAWYAFTDAPYSSTKRLTPWLVSSCRSRISRRFDSSKCFSVPTADVAQLFADLPETCTNIILSWIFIPFANGKAEILIVYLVLLRAIIIMLSSFKCTTWSSI